MLRTVIGLECSCHPLDQSDVGPQPITTWSPLFSHAMRFSCVFLLYWLRFVFSSVLIGCRDFDFDFHSPQSKCILNRKKTSRKTFASFEKHY